MGIIFGGIAPHGYSLIGEIAGHEYDLFQSLRDSMTQFGEKIDQLNCDTIIILTPHGLRLKDYNAIYVSEYCRGTLSQNGKQVSLEYQCDQEFARLILEEANQEGIPIVGCNFGALSGMASNIEMDWGTLIPLWFLKNKKQPKLIVINPTRDIPLNQLVRLGELINHLAQTSQKRIAIIASADQGHCHDVSGPYGFNEKSKVYDEKICELVRSNQLEKLLNLDESLIEEAKPDSLWQMLILHGAIKEHLFNVDFLNYQVPTYFGMLIATFE